MKNTGDGILATFDGPARAIRAPKRSPRAGMGVDIAARVMDTAGPDAQGLVLSSPSTTEERTRLSTAKRRHSPGKPRRS